KQAKQLRASAAVLRGLHLVPGKANKVLRFGDLSKEHADIHANRIEGAANFCDEIVDAIAYLKAVNPLIVKRDHGNLQARGYVRMLATEAHKLFGKRALYRTLARVASVAMEKEVDHEQVKKWCVSSEKRPHAPRWRNHLR